MPEEPANLYHSFIINSVNISAHLAWDPPLSDSPVTGYRVTWGQTLPNNHNVVDKNTVLTKVLNKVCENTIYIFDKNEKFDNIQIHYLQKHYMFYIKYHALCKNIGFCPLYIMVDILIVYIN